MTVRKLIAVSPETHHRLKVAGAELRLTIGQVIALAVTVLYELGEGMEARAREVRERGKTP